MLYYNWNLYNIVHQLYQFWHFWLWEPEITPHTHTPLGSWHSAHISRLLGLICWSQWVLVLDQVPSGRWITIPWCIVYPGDHGPNLGSAGTDAMRLLISLIFHPQMTLIPGYAQGTHKGGVFCNVPIKFVSREAETWSSSHRPARSQSILSTQGPLASSQSNVTKCILGVIFPE